VAELAVVDQVNADPCCCATTSITAALNSRRAGDEELALIAFN
jgi:hypothetical protein